MSDFIKTQDDDGVATITWNCVDRPMNVMSEQGFSDLNALVMGFLVGSFGGLYRD